MIRNKNLKNKIVYLISAAMISSSLLFPVSADADLVEEDNLQYSGAEYIDAVGSQEVPEAAEDSEEYGIVFDNLDRIPHVPEAVINDSECDGVVGAEGENITAASVRYIPIGHYSIPGHLNYQTSAKQQSIKSGTVNGARKYVNETCWAFATMGALEASYNLNHKISNTGSDNKPLTAADGAIDLSERQLVYFTYFNDNRLPSAEHPKAYRDPLGTLENDNNYLYIGGTTLDKSRLATVEEAFAFGGSPAYAFETVAMGIGPVSENAVPYSTEAQPTLNLQDVDGAHKFDTDYQMKSGRMFDMSQHNLVKNMILEYGAVSTSIYYDSKYLSTVSENGLNSVYFHHPSMAANHQVLIVGWDDEIPGERFKNGTHTEGAESAGGWLCKNSYGDSVSRALGGTSKEWAYDNGYFWVSYDTTDLLLSDGNIRRGFTFDMEEKEKEDVAYSHTYQYDGSTFSKEISVGSAYANVFNVDSVADGQTEYLRSVMVKLATPGSVYSVELFGDPDENDPTKGTAILKAPVWGKVDAAGYYDVPLGKGISISGYNTVSVVVRLYRSQLSDETPAIYSGVSGKYTMSVATNKILKGADDKAKTVAAMLYCLNTTKKGHSFIFTDANQQWEDMFKNADSLRIKGNVRIKLKTVTKLKEEELVEPDYTVENHYEKKIKQKPNYIQPRIEIDPTEAESGSTILYIGQTAIISIKGAQGATWTSKKPAIATVDDTGLITGIKKGTVEIEGTASTGERYTHKIRVRKSSFVSKAETKQITVSGQLSINGAFGDIQWMSTKPENVSIDEKTGTYKALKTGSSVITAIVGPTKLKCKIKVAKPVLKEKRITLAPEAPTHEIEFTKKAIDKKQLTYEVLNESVVSVDAATGTLKAVGNGSTQVVIHVLGTVVKCNVLVQGM